VVDQDWLEKFLAQAKTDIAGAQTESDLERCRVAYLGRSSELTKRLRSIASLPASERKQVGAQLNQAKTQIEGELAQRATRLASTAGRQGGLDVTLPDSGDT